MVKCKICREEFNSEDEMWGYIEMSDFEPGFLICYKCEDHMQQSGDA